ncbi:DUF3047 domain-containing protein [Actimicrobium sp. CCC2.4]|uniref:DUF3047 domain-containing protein n=1 Tax=Actimicrobium sp. CCC2.4 TaxID=3048606 RepID=UPI002AC9C649|nr:DUF3047 domain-containing protein [Actimicrobium sp. CCC2.4]MEB0135221.1 DUF3047 domain-containing protein [Actimicrobium sp. CCC2.4]WPX31016.1 DUF3047 domain-containing protein [Actimicrobium sp. CCC2.4]
MKKIASSLLCLLASASAQAVDIPAFSQMQAGAPVIGWSVVKPAAKVPDTIYTLVRDEGQTVLKAEADHSMSIMAHTVRIDLKKTPLLRWRWKIAAPVKGADMTKKSGDDYAGRIYVLFDYPVEKLSFATRAKLKIGEALYGMKIPTAAINYLWDNRQPVGTWQDNTYTDRARMLVVESGSDKAGQWITETRDVAADFRTAFGEEAPDVVVVALATDTDNTGEQATAWYGDLQFLAR